MVKNPIPRSFVSASRYGLADQQFPRGRIIRLFAEENRSAPLWRSLRFSVCVSGEVLALRVGDVDFIRKIVRVRQSIDAATRKVQAVKSNASSADVPMPSQLEARLRKHLQAHDGKTDLLFINRRGRPYSVNKLRAKALHPLLLKLGIPRGGFHSMRHGAASALLADGATPAVVQKQLRHSDPRITLGVYAHVIGDQQRNAVENRSAWIEQFAVN